MATENNKYKYVDKTVKKSRSQKCIAGNDDKLDSLFLVSAINLNRTIEYNLALVKTFPFRPLITIIQSAVYKWISKQIIAIANIMSPGNNVSTSNDLQNMICGFFNYTLSRYFNPILVILFYRWSLNLGKPFS